MNFAAHGLATSPYKSAYIAAKHGAVRLIKATALEAVQKPITCKLIFHKRSFLAYRETTPIDATKNPVQNQTSC